MFFTGLFSSHIPYIILAAVYSVSFGIYSFYYISNKITSKEQTEKQIELSDNIHSYTGDFHFKDHFSRNKANESFIAVIAPDHRLKPVFFVLKRNSPRKAIIINPHHEFFLFSRPPPAA